MFSQKYKHSGKNARRSTPLASGVEPFYLMKKDA